MLLNSAFNFASLERPFIPPSVDTDIYEAPLWVLCTEVLQDRKSSATRTRVSLIRMCLSGKASSRKSSALLLWPSGGGLPGWQGGVHGPWAEGAHRPGCGPPYSGDAAGQLGAGRLAFPDVIEVREVRGLLSRSGSIR